MSHLIIDLVCLAILGLTAFVGYRQGFFRSLVNILGSLLLYIVSALTSRIAAPILYEKYIGPYFMDRMQNYISNVGEGVRLESIVINALNKIPGFCKKALLNGTDSDSFVSMIISESRQSIEQTTNLLVNKYIPMVIIPLTQGILFILLITLLFLLLRGLIILLGSHASQKTLVGQIDSIVGALCGSGIGIILILVAAFAVHLFIGFTADSLSFCNSSLIEETFLFRFFYGLIERGMVLHI